MGLPDELEDEELDVLLDDDELLEEDELLEVDELDEELEELDVPTPPPHPARLKANKTDTALFQLILFPSLLLCRCVT